MQERLNTSLSTEFLKLNVKTLNELAVFADFSEGFTLGFIAVSLSWNIVSWDINGIADHLQHHPRCHNIHFETLKFNNPQLRYLIPEIKAVLPTVIKQANGKKLVFILQGLENSIGKKGEYPPFLVNLNWVRDVFTLQLPYLMVFVLPDYAIRRMALHAPDFWSWMSGGFQLKDPLRPDIETWQ